MSIPLAQQNGMEKSPTKYVYYNGTDTLLPGYALCYDIAATVGATDPKLARGTLVTKPVTANLMLFAGIVAAKVTGPAWVRVKTPKRGEFISVFCKANATVGVTALAPANDSYSLAAHSDATLNLPMVALAGETADTSGTAANKLTMFLGG